MPLRDYRGRSIKPAVDAIIAQKGKSYLLSDVDLSGGSPTLAAPTKAPKRACTYVHAVLLLHFFVKEMQDQIAPLHDHPCAGRSFTTATMHSLRAWMATFGRQAKFSEREVDELCHWNMGTMQRLYHRGKSGEELALRLQVIRLLAYPTWYSVGDIGRIAQKPPALEELPPLPGEGSTYRF